jgi:hypothetical protein
MECEGEIPARSNPAPQIRARYLQFIKDLAGLLVIDLS